MATQEGAVLGGGDFSGKLRPHGLVILLLVFVSDKVSSGLGWPSNSLWLRITLNSDSPTFVPPMLGSQACVSYVLAPLRILSAFISIFAISS